MNLKPWIDLYKNWYIRLGAKERVLFGLLVVAVFFSLYFNAFWKPAFNEIESLKKQQADNNNRAQMITSQFPDTAKAKAEYDSAKEKAAKAKKEIARIESALISPAQVPQLLSGLIKCGQGLALEFQSVKQDTETGKDGSPRLAIELKFDSPYADAATYVSRIEGISPSLKIDLLEVAESKADPVKLVSTTCRLSSLLAEGEGANVDSPLAFGQGGEAKIKVEKNPFMNRFKVVQAKKVKLKLTGITYHGDSSTAIINGTIVRVGNTIENQKVERILNDSVVVNDGTESYSLQVER